MKANTLAKAGASLVVTAMLTMPSIAGHAVGNGGDYIRGTFLQMGLTVIGYLENHPKGQAIVQANSLDLGKLKDSLTIQKVKVVDAELIDNGGSLVDAIGGPGSILLSKENWFDHFEKERDIYYLVLHEMLRENGIDDDDYKISGAIYPFEGALSLDTKLVALEPLIDSELLEGIVDQSKVALGGTACPKGEVTRLDFDKEKNILEVNFKGYRVVAQNSRPLDRKNCALTLPFSVPAGKKLIISQQDLSGKVHLAVGASGKISSEAFLAGSTSPVLSKEYKAVAQDVIGRTLLRKTETVESACGGSANLRVNTSAFVNGKDGDSIKVKQLRVYLALADCTN